MNFTLKPPPKNFASAVEREQWFEELWRLVRPTVSVSGDENFKIPAASSYHGISAALTTGRTLTLPATTALLDGMFLIIQDESGTAGSHTVSLVASAGDTLSGATSISSNFGRRIAVKRKDTWFVQ